MSDSYQLARLFLLATASAARAEAHQVHLSISIEERDEEREEQRKEKHVRRADRTIEPGSQEGVCQDQAQVNHSQHNELLNRGAGDGLTGQRHNTSRGFQENGFGHGSRKTDYGYI